MQSNHQKTAINQTKRRRSTRLQTDVKVDNKRNDKVRENKTTNHYYKTSSRSISMLKGCWIDGSSQFKLEVGSKFYSLNPIQCTPKMVLTVGVQMRSQVPLCFNMTLTQLTKRNSNRLDSKTCFIWSLPKWSFSVSSAGHDQSALSSCNTVSLWCWFS